MPSTKQQRRDEREKVGKLRKLVVSQVTEDRYRSAFREFMHFHQLHDDFVIEPFNIFDEVVGEFMKFLWESHANYSVSAIQFYRLQVKSRLPWSWKLVKAWSQVELPLRATSLSIRLLLAMVGTALRGGHFLPI